MAAPTFPGTGTLSFGVFQLNLQTGELHKSGQKIGLRPQAIKVLILLTAQAGELVTRDELKDQIWGSDTFVDFEHGLNLCIRQIRAALDDNANTPRYIETLPRRGYRFIAPLKTTGQHAQDLQPTTSNSSEAIRGATRSTLIQKPAAPRTTHWLWISACVILLALAAGIYVLQRPSRPRAQPPAGKVMFAVLPFENLSGDAQQEYFSDGLTEEMISRLGQMDPQRLGVIARTSAVQYKGTKKRIDQIGKELGVDYILEGTVRRDGNRVRISAQLIQVNDQTHLWAKNYERDLRNILSVQEDVAQAIANEIEIKLTPEQQTRLQGGSAPVNPAAYEAYLKGRYYLTQPRRRELKLALDYLQQAIRLDSHYALAYASLAETYNSMNTSYLPPLEAGPDAKAAVMKALELDESLPLAHAILGKIHLFYDWDWPGAEKEFLRSLELNQNLPEAHLGYADYLVSIGRFDEALAHVRTASALDPLSFNTRSEAVWATLHSSRRYQEMIDESRKIRELPPDFTAPFGDEAFAFARLGRFQEAIQAAKAASDSDNPTEVAQAAQVYAEVGKKEEARKLLRRLLAERKKKFVCGNNMATVYADLGENDNAFYWLGEGIKQRSL